MEDKIDCTPPKLREAAESTLSNLLPKKSREIYENQYKIFETWCKQNSVESISENIMLAYFDMLSKKKKSSTLWSSYSMLRSCLSVYKNVNISNYAKLQAFLKRLSEGYEAKKSKILELEHINRFIQEADDKLYLAMKVVLLMGYNGACRREELTNMSIDDIEYKSDIIVVRVPKTKNYKPRQFVVTEQAWITIINKYVALRSRKTAHRLFFVTYRSGYCVTSPIGINTIGKIPKVIATFLKLPNPELYTGHCFRRSSVSHLANRGGDLLTIKNHGGWKSSAVAEGYIEESMQRKSEVAKMLSINSKASTSSTSTITSAVQLSEDCNINKIAVANNEIVEQNFRSIQNIPGVIINAKDTCTVTVNIYNNRTDEK